MEDVFVYGTLMEGYSNHKILLEGKVLATRNGTLKGALYQLPEGYPGLLEEEGIVLGQVLTLANMEDLEDLDPLEGYFGPGRNNTYDRVRRMIKLTDGEEAEAWVYVFRDDLYAKHRGEFVPNGDWAAFMKKKVH